MTASLRLLVTLIGTVTAFVAAGTWLFPVEVFQGWNVQQAGTDPYARFEAAGQAEALTWLARLLLPVAALVLLWSLGRWSVVTRATSAIVAGFSAATRIDDRAGGTVPWRTWLWRGFIVAWFGLFVLHAAQGLADRGRDWAYYRFNSGADVLPNISLRNRAVIRYLQQVTPENARILACSDQSLFFLNYYLRPRRVFHFVHPDAEFVIPQPGQARPLPAYRFADLDPNDVASIAPDYVLEYFEGPDFVDPVRGADRDRIEEDPRWVDFWRQTSADPDGLRYLVSLRPFGGTRPVEAAGD